MLSGDDDGVGDRDSVCCVRGDYGNGWHLGGGSGEDDRGEDGSCGSGAGGEARGSKSCSKDIHWPSSQQGLQLPRGGSALGRMKVIGLLYGFALRASRRARISLSVQQQGLWVPGSEEWKQEVSGPWVAKGWAGASHLSSTHLLGFGIL